MGFALPPLAQLRAVPPLRVLRKDIGLPSGRSSLGYLVGLVGFLLLLLWSSNDLKVGAVTAGGFAGGLLVFALAAWGVLQLLSPLRSITGRLGISWRFAIAAVQRRPVATIVQLVSLAVGLMALLLLTVTRTDLVSAWRNAAPPDAPNRFVINVQPDQAAGVAQRLKDGGIDAELHPMIRGRLVKLNGKSVGPENYTDDRAQRLVDREFNISYTAEAPSHNPITAGTWFKDGSEELSIEEGIAKTLGIKLGDDVDLVLKALKKSPATFLPAVPPIYDRIAAAAAERGVALDSIRFSISGAMNLPMATVETWEKATGGYLIEGYGLTETSPIALGNPFGPSRKPGTVGVPFPLTDIRVVDPRNVLLDRAPGEEGELLVRGPQVFAGYWNRPKETEEALLEGGWFRTGDIVSVDKDDFVTVRDRIKELIITGGFNVSPTEVEDVLCEYPGVLDVCVVGLPRTGGGEDVVAAVVPSAGSGVDPEALLAFARENLAAYKVPRRVAVVDELPRSLIGKVLRREVRDALVAGR